MSQKLRALVRRPSPKMAEGEITHITRQEVSYPKALAQWENYVATLNELGWETIEVPAVTDCPDQVFIEDTMFVYRDLAVITRIGAEVRRPEVEAAAKTIADCGYRLAHIEDPGCLDGGDILKFGNQIWVGLTPNGRSNTAGVQQLSKHLKEFDLTVTPVVCSKILHLKSGITALYDGTIIGYPDKVDNPKIWNNFLPVPEFLGSQVLLLENNTILISASAPKTKALLEKRGYQVVAVDISEFEKMEGSVTCMSVRLRHQF